MMTIDSIHLHLRPRPLALLIAFLAPCAAQALALRTPQGQAIFGQPVRLTIPIAGEDAARLDASCFRLVPPRRPTEQEYVLRRAQLTLERHGEETRLVIASAESWRQPVLEFAVIAECGGHYVVREYTMLAEFRDDAHVSSPSTAPNPANGSVSSGEAEEAGVGASGTNNASSALYERFPSRKKRTPASLPASAGTTGEEVLILTQDTNLNALARQRYPNDWAARDAFRARVAAANLDLFAGRGPVGRVPLPAGTMLRIPAQAANEDKAPSFGQETKVGQVASSATKKNDRLMIGAAPSGKAMSAEVAAAIERLQSLLDRQSKREEEINTQLATIEQSFATMSQTLQRLEERLKTLDEERLQAQREREALARRIEEAKSQTGFVQLLLTVLFAGVGMAAGLFLYDRWRRRSSPAPVPEKPAAEKRTEPHAREPQEKDAPMRQGREEREPSAVVSPGKGGQTAPSLARATPAGPSRLPGARLPGQRFSSSLAKGDGMPQLEKIVTAMIASGLYQRAAETLITAIRRDPASSIGLWPLLEDLGRRYDFSDGRITKAIHELKLHLNVALPWRQGANRQGGDSLVDYPHVTEQLVRLWGSEECDAYLRRLLADTREGEREGFPLPVIEEILLLAGVHRRRRQVVERTA